MEIQWQKALDLLTSPTNSNELIAEKNKSKSIDIRDTQHEKHAGIRQIQRNLNNEYETPAYNHNLRRSSQSKNNLCPSENIFDSSYADKLNEYIESLLIGSPRDLEKINDILSSKKSSCSKDSENKLKPPWK